MSGHYSDRRVKGSRVTRRRSIVCGLVAVVVSVGEPPVAVAVEGAGAARSVAASMAVVIGIVAVVKDPVNLDRAWAWAWTCPDTDHVVAAAGRMAVRACPDREAAVGCWDGGHHVVIDGWASLGRSIRVDCC